MPLASYTTTCRQCDEIAHDIYEIRFTKPDAFDYKSGQFIMFDFPLVEDEKDIQPRAYSIASHPDEDDLLFVIKYVENGRASRFIREKLKVGDEFRMQGPLGFFGLNAETPKDYLFVCTATGNAPFRPMAMDAVKNADRRVDMIFGVRHEEDLFWVDLFKEMEEQHPNFHFHPMLSKPGENWDGHTGHVQDIVPEVCKNLDNVNLYVCGNPAMTNEIKKLWLEDWGQSKDDLHVEGFI